MEHFKEIYLKRRTRNFITSPEGKYIKVSFPTTENYTDYKYILPSEIKSGYTRTNNEKYSPNSTPDKHIVGTALAVTSTLWELALLTSNPWFWFRGKIRDGYWLVFFSPLVLINWLVLAILYLPLAVLLSILVVASAIWTLLFEVPAAILNDEDMPLFE